MVYTSYFAKLNKLPRDIIPISICGKAPTWYDGLQYKKLAPKYDFFMKWKETHDMTTEPMYYMTSDSTIFEFTNENMNDIWKDAQLHEIEWLESEKK